MACASKSIMWDLVAFTGKFADCSLLNSLCIISSSKHVGEFIVAEASVWFVLPEFL